MIGAYKILVSLILWPLWLAYFVIAMSVFLIYMTFFPRKYYHYYVRPMCWFFYLFGCQWLKMDGRVPPPQNGPYLYMINHGSLFDLFAVFFYMKHYVTAVGAIEEFRWPIWGAVGRKYGIVPIQRSNIEKAVHSLENVENAVRKGISFLIAPEGTRTRTGKLGQFKKGPFHLSKNAAVSIVPIGIIGAFGAKRKNDWRLKPGILTTCFGDVINHDEYDNMSVGELRDYVRGKIKELSEKY